VEVKLLHRTELIVPCGWMPQRAGDHATHGYNEIPYGRDRIRRGRDDATSV
jgi:hypothetical protein